jgi:galactarate dehydratase
MDGSATVVREGYAPYGTDDVSDDVTQDAVLI